jgi:hypothetical protein
LQWGLIAVAMGCSLACYAKSTGVGEDSALQSGPCYQALVDRSAAQPTTAPPRELGSACETEHGDVDKAWARVLRLWESDSVPVPDYDNYRPADAPTAGPAPYGLALVEILLVYALLGTPMRSAARLMTRGSGGKAEAAFELLASLIVRGLIGMVLIWVFGLAYATFFGSVLLMALILWRLNRPHPATGSSAADTGQEPASGFSKFAAETINDVAGSAIGLLGLALLAQHNLLLFSVALAFAITASTPIVILARRRLRANPLIPVILSALLAAAAGVFALSDPPIATMIGGAVLPNLLVPLALAAAALGLGWRNWRDIPPS